jgi:hypothetical protein
MSGEEFFWIVAVGWFSYGCSKCTSAEVWEWLKSMALIAGGTVILIGAGYWLLLAL